MVDIVGADGGEADGGEDFVAGDGGAGGAGAGVDELVGVVGEGLAVGEVGVGLARVRGGVVPSAW